MANLKQSTLDQLANMGYSITLWDNLDTVDRPEVATSLSITNWDENIHEAINNLPKKKEITVNWVLSKINKDSSYENLSKLFNKIINKDNLNVYPTTYGIGFFNALGKDNKTAERLASILTENGINFKNELSEAGWVYRFVISKSKSNLERIKNLVEGKQILPTKKVNPMVENIKTFLKTKSQSEVLTLLLVSMPLMEAISLVNQAV